MVRFTIDEAQSENARLPRSVPAQNDEIVTELTCIGRRMRYDGQFRGLEELVRGLIELSDEALSRRASASAFAG
jgi:flagellar biosynthesis regulator FlbT